MKSPILLSTCALVLTLTALPAFADSYNRRHWDDGYDSYRRGLQQRDYETQSTTMDAAGNPITTRTEVERDQDEYSRKTTVTGPDGQYSAQELEVEYGKDKIKRKVTTTNPDGTVDIQNQRYKLND